MLRVSNFGSFVTVRTGLVLHLLCRGNSDRGSESPLLGRGWGRPLIDTAKVRHLFLALGDNDKFVQVRTSSEG